MSISPFQNMAAHHEEHNQMAAGGYYFQFKGRETIKPEESIWYTVSPDFIIEMSGTGTISIDSKSINGTIEENAATYTLTNGNQVKYFKAEDTMQIRFNLTGDVTIALII